MKSMSFRWDIINAHARDISLTQQAIHSFDDFIARSVPEIIKSNNTIEVSSQLVNNGPKRSVVFSNPTYKNPSVVEKNQDVRALTPFEARTRDLTFSAPMYVDISYKETPKAKAEVHKQIYIGRMPVMVKSSMDNCSVAYTECEHDPGGYMIINGNEKVVIVQQRVIPNLILCFSHHNNYQSVVHSCSNKWTNAYCALKIQGNSLIPARVDISGVTSSIPVITFLSALGWSVSNIKNRLRLNEEEWDLWYKDTGFKTINTKTSMAFVLNRMKNKKNPKRSFLYLFYPHIGRDVDFDVLVSNKWPKRKEIAIQQTISLIKTFRGERKCDSRDQLINKRLDTAGVMMTSLFALIWSKYMEEIEKMIQKCCDKNKKVRIEKLISTTTITDGMKYALATGNWKSKDMTSSRVGVSQSLSRNTFISCISQLRRVDSNIEAEQKMINPRKLYGDVWGFLCPNETPEGSPTGLVYQMGITAQISTESHNQRLFSTITFYPNSKTTVFHNGIPVGNVKDAIQTCQNIKMLRRNRLIALDVSVSYVNEAIHVWSDTGRIYRPVFVVENGKLNITNDILDDLKKGRTLFNDLYQLGVVENIDSFETSNCYIALNPEDITPQHTHCELHPSMIFGTLVSSSPFADMNPGPRNTYQAAMGKQAMGIYISTYQKRFDTTGLILNYVQKPLAITKSAKTLKQNEMPAGFNAIVACMCDEGYNQEDSTQWNKASIERGMGRSTTYQTVTASTVTRGSGYHKFKRPKRNETKNMRDDKLYSCLDDDGLPPPGTSITAGQVAIGRTTMPKDTLVHKNDVTMSNVVKARDASIFHKKSSGVVDDTIVFQNDQGGQTAKVKIRVQKIPELGDKFCVSENSFVMTTQGWVQMKDITLKHKVATLQDGKYLKYVHPTNTYSFDCHDEELYHLDAQQVKIICTKNHKLYIKKRNKHQFEFVDAKDVFGKRVRHKKDALNDMKDQQNILIMGKEYNMDGFLQLLGAFISDGFVDIGKKHYRIAICMIKKRKKTFIKKVLNSLGIPYNMRPDRVLITHNGLKDYFKSLSVGAPNKYLPAFVWNLSQRQSVVLMNALLQGDGSYTLTGSVGYFTSSKQLANDIQRLALHCGWSGTIKLYKGREKGKVSFIRNRKIISNYDALTVRIVKKKNNPQVNHGHVHQQKRQTEEYIRYTGKVGCIEVPTSHLFFYKEDIYSPPCWTGNSSRHAQKGTIGMIYQQQDLPFTQDGITPDIIINPHCMPSRMTVGHFTEQLASKVAAITGRQVDATSFAHAPVETFCNELKAAGFQPYGNEQLYSGRTGLPLKAKVFIGPLYYQKLKHMSSDKLHARPRGKIVGLTRQPNEGRVNGGGLRWGEMERDVGISYGASKVLNERMLISSDLYEAPVCDKCGFIGLKRKVTGRAYVCTGCSGEIKTVKMPYASKLLMQELMSMGIAPRLRTEEVKENI